MSLTQQIAKQLREVFFGGNWTASNLKDNLADVTWEQATAKVHSFNTIAALVFHIDYFVEAVVKVLKEETLDAHDKYSFNVPEILSEEDWKKLRDKAYGDAEDLAKLIEAMPKSKLWEDFSDKKYGNYYRNLQGIVEHTHYHLGQIVLVKKLVIEEEEKRKTDSF